MKFKSYQNPFKPNAISRFYVLDQKYKEEFGTLVREMEAHQQFLVAATQQVNNANLKQVASTSRANDSPSNSASPNPLETTNEDAEELAEVKVVENRKPVATNGPVKETLLGKRGEMTTRERLPHGDETAPPADPLTT
jgi:hypothetical protein